MRLAELRLRNFRAFADVELSLAPGLNVFTGANGAGKTSVLEAAYVLSHARSFRSANRDVLLRSGQSELSVFGLMESGAGDASVHRLGLVRGPGRWLARIDGREPQGLAELLRRCAVVCFEPGSHALISGVSAERRTYVDWGLFHVEQAFVPLWRTYQRVLKQRNALLKQVPDVAELAPWDIELAAAGEALGEQRRHYLAGLRPYLERALTLYLPELGLATLAFEPGWPQDGSLLEALAARRSRDIARGFTSAGAHRADWSLVFAEASQREYLSRGQEKLCALACVLAQAQHYHALLGDAPIVCLDDLASELDLMHQRQVIESLPIDTQILVTGTDMPEALKSRASEYEAAWFHVERGTVRREG